MHHKMEEYKFKIKRKFYPGEIESLPPNLPKGYVNETSLGVPQNQNCLNCYFSNNGYCNYWNAEIRENYWCNIWTDPQTLSQDLPSPPPCITGITIPIVISEDFNDIGVYTPWDGLVLQRDVINNFLYTGNGLTVTVTNTSDVDFKRFLTFGDYTIIWGDGNTNTLTLDQPIRNHTYSAPGEYKITLQQINPWGTTRISKIINLPYNSNVIIPNPYGTVEIHPPNFGDPIGCDTVLQDYIFSGDSNPDVYDFFSFNYVTVPFEVTGYTTTSNLNLFLEYGSNGLPQIGVPIELTSELSGEILEVTNQYTAYTINDIIYTDFSGGTTLFNALSTGLNKDNLEWECCDETLSDPCQCKEKGNVIPKGDYDPNIIYMQGTTVNYDGCCWYCNPKSFSTYECDSAPTFGDNLWEPCLPCVENENSLEPQSGVVNEFEEYNPSFTYRQGDRVSFYGNIYTFEGTRLGNSNSGSTNINGTSGWIDLTYVTTYLDVNNVPVTEKVPYQDEYQRLWVGGYTTNPEFNVLDWENKSNQELLKYSIWSG